MQQALRQANWNVRVHRLRQLWLAWLALVVAMLALIPAPRPTPPVFALACPVQPVGDASAPLPAAPPTPEIHPHDPRASCASFLIRNTQSRLQHGLYLEPAHSTRQFLPVMQRAMQRLIAHPRTHFPRR